MYLILTVMCSPLICTGRMFEAAPSVMLGSLDKVSNFRGDVLVWPGKCPEYLIVHVYEYIRI